MKQTVRCSFSEEDFSVSPLEQNLRKIFGFENSLPTVKPKYRFREIGAFWPQWNLYKRKCDKTGQNIISIFREDCPYPVWKREEWIKHANPPSQDFNFNHPFFKQARELFSRCPIPHNFQSHNQNCEYTDDWYKSKNCYLCHSGQNNEDCRYCYGSDSIKDTFSSIFAFNSELCIDLINSSNCYQSFFLLNCKNVRDSGFLYDCRNCQNCLFCFNLRNKKYCFGNQQLTKEEFEKKKKAWNCASIKKYEEAKKAFAQMMEEMAWHRALQIDHCENSSGNFIRHTKDCENCYMLSYHENCANVSFCGPDAKTILDSLGTVGSELSYYSSLPVYSYDVRFCFSVDHCRFVEYSAYLFNCKYCFGCCGLVNEKYCIFNKKYSEEEFHKLHKKIVQHMKQIGEYGKIFPGNFAPNPYDESYSGFHFPLTLKEQSKLKFYAKDFFQKDVQKIAEISEIPDSLEALTPEKEMWLTQQVFWDKKYKRPFRIQKADIDFARSIGIALPNKYYISRIQSNLQWMPSTGELRKATCAKSGKEIKTYWPKKYDKRILSEDEYLKFIN